MISTFCRILFSSFAACALSFCAQAGEEPLSTVASQQNTPGFLTNLGGDFELLTSDGEIRTVRNPSGHPQILFFGYANCQAICSVALPRMAEAVSLLADRGLTVTPLMITVDPKNDTVETIGPALERIDPRFVGLTGDLDALQVAYDAFQIERKLVFVHPEYGDVYAHGSYIYALDANGKFLTILPPVLGPERIAEILYGYFSKGDQL